MDGNEARVRAAAEAGVNKAVDPDRLLDGEDPDTEFAEDALHWVQVYSELVQFKERVVQTAHSSLDGARTEVVAEVRDTDLAVLAAERLRLRRRLSYWEERYAELLAQAAPDNG